MSEKEKDEPIRVEDRRHFDKEGNLVAEESQSSRPHDLQGRKRKSISLLSFFRLSIPR
jgi:hypothetical protein